MAKQSNTLNDGIAVKWDIVISIALYIVTLTVHILLVLNATIFNLTPDEYSVTAIAAYFNGYDWSSTVSTGGYYGYFQSLFYIPVFSITDDPYMQYKLMLGINGILISFVPVIVYYLSRKWFDVGRIAAVIFSIICGWYPCYILLTKYTWNETMCGLLPWVFVLLMCCCKYSRSAVKKQTLSVLAGLTLVAGYAAHGRMLALALAGLILPIVVYFSMNKTKIFAFAGLYGGAVVGFVADIFIKNHIQTVLWNTDGGSIPTNTIEKMAGKLVDSGADGGAFIERLFTALTGHFFYFITSTWGFGAICIVVVITAIVIYYINRRKAADGAEENSDITVFCWFVFLLMGAIFAVSVLFKSTSTLFYERMDTAIYGRYTEACYPLAIFAALVLMYKQRVSAVQGFVAMLTGAFMEVMTMLFVVPVVTGGERFVCAMILGLAPLRFGEKAKDLLTESTFIKLIIITMVAFVLWLAAIMLSKSMKKGWLAGALLLLGVLVYSNVYCYINYSLTQSRNATTGAKYMTQAIELLDGRFESVTCVGVSKERYVKAQFLYPDLDIKVLSSVSKLNSLEDMPDIILANKKENLNLWCEDVYLLGDINNSVHIYAATDEAIEWAREKGLKVSENGTVRYSAAELAGTTSVTKKNYDEMMDLNYQSDREKLVTAGLPVNSSVYTNYSNFYKSGVYHAVFRGTGLESARITLTAKQGTVPLDFEIIESSNDVYHICFELTQKTDDVRVKLTNTGQEPATISGLLITAE